ARVYVFMPLDVDAVVSPGGDVLRVSSAGGAVPGPPAPLPEPEPEPERERRGVLMPRPEESPNGPPANGHADGVGLDELIQEAEGRRGPLLELSNRAAHLPAGLKRHRKRGRAVEAALAALRLKLPALP